MEITIEHDFTIEPELRGWLEKRLEISSSRFGPIETARVVIRLGGAAEPWTVTVAIRAFEGELGPRVVADDLGVAIDEALVAAAGQLRGMKWKTYGVAANCRWCDGEEFLHMRRPQQPALATDNGKDARPLGSTRVSRVRSRPRMVCQRPGPDSDEDRRCIDRACTPWPSGSLPRVNGSMLSTSRVLGRFCNPMSGQVF